MGALIYLYAPMVVIATALTWIAVRSAGRLNKHGGRPLARAADMRPGLRLCYGRGMK